MFESVVIGWDGKAAAEEALAWALGRPIGFRYWVTRVVDDRAAVAGDTSPMSAEADAEERVRARVADAGRSNPATRIAGQVVVGDPMEQLERRTGPTALLVLGSDRAPGTAPRWRWTAGARVAARAHGPVLTVPQGTHDRTGPVLVGVDGTESSRAAALHAAEFAAAVRAPLVVLHAWQAAGEGDSPFVPDEPVGGLAVDATGASDDVPSRTLEHAHRELLASVVEEVRAAHPELRVESRLLHAPAPTALQAAAEQASVVVLGRHSRWSAATALLGSVTHEMLLTSPAPVLVVGRRDVPLRTVPAHVPALEPEVLGAARQVFG